MSKYTGQLYIVSTAPSRNRLTLSEAALLGLMPPTKGAIVLLGEPGVGKSTLGRALEGTHSDTTVFLSVGDRLREEGWLSQEPTAARSRAMRERAKEILDATCTCFSDRCEGLSSPSVHQLGLQGPPHPPCISSAVPLWNRVFCVGGL